MAYFKNIFLILLIIKLSSGQCSNKKMKWCINSEYVADGEIVDKESCKKRPCIISTCPYGYMNYKRTCIKMDSVAANFSEILTLYRLMSGKLVKTDKSFDNLFQVVNYKNKTIHIRNNCTHSFFTIGKNLFGNFLDDGSFFVKPSTVLPTGEYIVRFSISNESGVIKPQIKIKFAKDEANISEIDETLDPIFDYVMLASVFFMILVLVVYSLCKDLRTTAGFNFMTYVASLAIAFLLLSIRSLATRYEQITDTGCYIISPLIHFFTFSSYMWMNIMGFDIWWTLRNMFYQRRLGKRYAVNYYKYMWYCIIVWVPTLVYVIIEICLDEFADIDGPLFIKCTACSNKWYLLGPDLALQILNFIPFVLIIFNLVRINNSNVKFLNSADSSSTCPKQNALLCLKISIMLGTNWFLDIMLAFFYDDLPGWFRYTVKSYNALFGLILFLVYIFKANILLKLFKRFSINNKVTKNLEKRVSRKCSNYSKKSSQQNDSSTSTTVQQVVNY